MFSLDSRVGGLSKEPPAADGPIKDEADKQFRGTGDELMFPLSQLLVQGWCIGETYQGYPNELNHDAVEHDIASRLWVVASFSCLRCLCPSNSLHREGCNIKSDEYDEV